MRDYNSDLDNLIEKHMAQGPYNSRVLAGDITNLLRTEQQVLLLGWLDQNAEHFIWQHINDIDRARRAKAAREARGHQFAEAAEEFEQTGNKAVLSDFLGMRFTVENGTRKRLAELTADDLRHVETSYLRRADDQLMWAAFAKALHTKLEREGGTVEDHYTEEQLKNMLAGFANPQGERS